MTMVSRWFEDKEVHMSYQILFLPHLFRGPYRHRIGWFSRKEKREIQILSDWGTKGLSVKKKRKSWWEVRQKRAVDKLSNSPAHMQTWNCKRSHHDSGISNLVLSEGFMGLNKSIIFVCDYFNIVIGTWEIHDVLVSPSYHLFWEESSTCFLPTSWKKESIAP